MKKDTSIDKNFTLTSQINTLEKSRDEQMTGDKIQAMRATFGSQMDQYFSHGANVSRYSRQSVNKSTTSSKQVDLQSNRRDNTIHYVSQRGDRYQRSRHEQESHTNSKYSKKSSERVAP